MMAVKSGLLAGVLACSGCVASAMADTGPTIYGTSFPLTLTLNIERSTCLLSLVSPESMEYTAPVSPLDFVTVGPIVRMGTKDITLRLDNCTGSAATGVTPAIKVTGQTQAGNDDLFQYQNSQISGALGFGLRYKDASGVPGSYIKNNEFVDLAASGGEHADGNVNFIVDMRYLGGAITGTGSVMAKINFEMSYH